MTKSEFIRKRCEPLFTMVEKFVHPEEKPVVRARLELWVLRLVTDVQNLGSTDLSDIDVDSKYGDTPLD